MYSLFTYLICRYRIHVAHVLPKLKFLDALPIRDEEFKESFHSGFVALTWKHLRKEMVSSTLIGITFANLTSHLFSYSVIINSASFQNINPNIRTLSVLQRKGYGTESWNTFTLGNFQKAIDLSQTLICDLFLSSKWWHEWCFQSNLFFR